MRWPFCGPSIIDEENHPRMIAHALIANETHEAMIWLLQRLVDFVPALAQSRVVFTDGALNQDVIESAFADATQFRCCWHMLERDLPHNLASEPQFKAIKQLATSLVHAATRVEFDAVWDASKETISAKARKYLEDHWLPEADHWSAYARNQHFTAGRTSNATISWPSYAPVAASTTRP